MVLKNQYKVEGNLTKIYLRSEKHGDFETIITTSKLEKVNNYPNIWNVKLDKKNNNFYVYGRVSINKKQVTIFLHRWITDAGKGYEVDHGNHNTLDNTDNNLKVVSVSENQLNRKGASKRSSSGIRGVYWHKASKKWCAQIRINGKKIVVGNYNDIHEAAHAINEAKKQYIPFSYDIVS